MSGQALVLDVRDEFSLTIRAKHLEVSSVEFTPKSDQPAKQRAEVMTLIRDLMAWAATQGIVVAVATDGRVTVREAATDAR